MEIKTNLKPISYEHFYPLNFAWKSYFYFCRFHWSKLNLNTFGPKSKSLSFVINNRATQGFTFDSNGIEVCIF